MIDYFSNVTLLRFTTYPCQMSCSNLQLYRYWNKMDLRRDRLSAPTNRLVALKCETNKLAWFKQLAIYVTACMRSMDTMRWSQLSQFSVKLKLSIGIVRYVLGKPVPEVSLSSSYITHVTIQCCTAEWACCYFWCRDFLLHIDVKKWIIVMNVFRD